MSVSLGGGITKIGRITGGGGSGPSEIVNAAVCAAWALAGAASIVSLPDCPSMVFAALSPVIVSLPSRGGLTPTAGVPITFSIALSW